MRLLSIDPGVGVTGAAVFNLDTGRLFAARRFRGRGFKDDPTNILELARTVADFAGPLGPYRAIVCEWPQIYRESRQRFARKDGGMSKRDPNDLLPLAALNAAITALMWPHTTLDCTFELYRPADWKAQKKANPTARWVLKQLSDSECMCVEDLGAFVGALQAAELAGEEVSNPVHNTIDAIGVGLHHLGRLKPRSRIIER